MVVLSILCLGQRAAEGHCRHMARPLPAPCMHRAEPLTGRVGRDGDDLHARRPSASTARGLPERERSTDCNGARPSAARVSAAEARARVSAAARVQCVPARARCGGTPRRPRDPLLDRPGARAAREADGGRRASPAAAARDGRAQRHCLPRAAASRFAHHGERAVLPPQSELGRASRNAARRCAAVPIQRLPHAPRVRFAATPATLRIACRPSQFGRPGGRRRAQAARSPSVTSVSCRRRTRWESASPPPRGRRARP